jgi:AraC-like DNA-binding protein
MLDLPAPLSEIASSVGYDSDHGFNRTFRRYFGEPPARWRKQRRLQLSAGTST